MKGSPKSGAEENTFIKAYDDLEKAQKAPLRGPEAYPLLEIVHGPKQGAWFTVAYQKEITLGRAATNSIVLEDNSVSRAHAVLQSSGDTYTLRDIGSRNGTFLNNKKIPEETSVHHMDIIKIGIYTLRFLQEPTDQVYEFEIKEEHTPRVEETGPEIRTEMPAEAEAEKFAPAPKVKRPEDKTINEDLAQIISHPPVPQVAAKKPARGLRNLLILLLILGVVGGGGFLAHYFGAFDMLREYFGGTTTAQKPKKPVSATKPATEPAVPPVAPAGEMISVFLEADAQPLPAKVFYKGNELGTTPFKISLQVPTGKPEELSAEFLLEGINQRWAEKATFQATKPDEVLPVKFLPKWGELKVAAMPKDGQLFLQGQYQGVQGGLPATRLESFSLGSPLYLPFGKYVAEIRMPEIAPGTRTPTPTVRYRREFELGPNSLSTEVGASDETIKTFPAQIITEPTGAELYVDGRKVGVTPFQGNLPQGPRKLVFKKEGFSDFEKEINLALNAPYSASFNLNTTPAGVYVNKGRDFLKRGQYNEAIEQFAEALKSNPDPTELSQLHLLLGKAFIQTKTYDQALAYFQKARENPENLLQADLGIAEAQGGLGQPDQALVKLIDVVLNTKDPKIKSEAESVYHRLYPMRSVIYVASDPPGAAVTVNDNPIGQPTPVILSDLMIGTYRLGVKKDGFKPFESRVTLGMSSIKPVVVKLDPIQ